MKWLTDVSLEKMTVERRRNVRTNCTATPMDKNLPTDRYDSVHCMWPEKGHKPCAIAENLMGGCLLYKRLSHFP